MVINSIFEPVVNVAVETFMQTKIPPDVQGRVFSASDFLSQAMIPITPLLAGFFGETIFEPAMAEGGALADIFGWLVGVGPGSGFGLMILLCGIGATFVGLSGYLISAIHNVDELLPDYTPVPPVGMVMRIQPRTAKRKAHLAEGNKHKPKKLESQPVKDAEKVEGESESGE